MSYILDALKKLEHEKTRKSRGTGMNTISGSLFESEQPVTAATTSGWKIVLAVTAAVVLTFAATWYVLQPARGREKPAARRTAQETASAPAPVSAVAPPVAPVVPVVAEPAKPVPPAAQITSAQPVPSASLPKNTAVAPAEASAKSTAIRQTVPPQRSRAKERSAQRPSGEQLAAAPAGITLSGIAWQDERSARRAVVNGFLMQEGGVVSGARITDIYQDRVRFTLSGTYFEIPLTSTGFPTAGK